MNGRQRIPRSIEIYVGAAAVVLATAAYVCDCVQMGVVGGVFGAVAYGIVIGTLPGE